jgi:hypothetical protein
MKRLDFIKKSSLGAAIIAVNPFKLLDNSQYPRMVYVTSPRYGYDVYIPSFEPKKGVSIHCAIIGASVHTDDKRAFHVFSSEVWKPNDRMLIQLKPDVEKIILPQLYDFYLFHNERLTNDEHIPFVTINLKGEEGNYLSVCVRKKIKDGSQALHFKPLKGI